MLIVNGKQSNGENLIFDDGFQFGKGVFETILVTHKPQFLKEHFTRLEKARAVLGITNKISIKELSAVIEKYNLSNCVLKIMVSDHNIVLATRENNYKKEDYQNGYRLKVSNLLKNKEDETVFIKSFHRLDTMLEKEKAKKEGYDEVLFFNAKAELTEAGSSNIFIVKNNEIFTPSLKCGLLDGIVRGYILNSYNVTEKVITLVELLAADEVFLTNSVMGIMKVRSVNSVTFGSSKVSDQIQKDYNAYIQAL